MKCDSVLFDLDGTLWDASPACAYAWTESLRAVGRPDLTVTAADVHRFTGLQIDTILKEFFPSVASESHAALLEFYKERELEIMRTQGGTLYSGTEEVLRKLHRTHRLFIVSNCFEGYIENFFRLAGLGPLFDGFESLGRTGQPKAQNIAAVIKEHKLRLPAYVGDTAHDAEAARKNLIPFVFAEYGFGHVDSPRYRIGTIGELMNHFS